MGRPSKLTEREYSALSEDGWREIAQAFINSGSDEACIALLMRMHCIFGDIRALLRTSKISSYKFEYLVNGGRVDLALFHTDGGVSLVEIKGQGGVRDVVAGIGQLFFYEAVFAESKPKAKPPAYINKYLVSPVFGGDAEVVGKACSLAGVDFVQYAPFSLIRNLRNGCTIAWVGNGA